MKRFCVPFPLYTKKGQFVKVEKAIPEMVEVTKTIKIPKKGGSEAAAAITAFGFAYLDMLNNYEQGKIPPMNHFLDKYKNTNESCKILLQDVEDIINRIEDRPQMRKIIMGKLSGFNV